MNRILAEAEAAADEGDLGDELDLDERDIDGGALALLGSQGSRDERGVTPPITFVGIVRGVDGMRDDWRYTDAIGSVSSALTLYRFRQMLEREGRDEELAVIDAGLDAQYEADAELVKVADFLGRVVYRPRWEVAEGAATNQALRAPTDDERPCPGVL